MARTLLADPEFPNRAKEGNWEDIIPCVGDLTCLVTVGSDKKICCLTNPAIGQEEEMVLTPAKKSKKVLIVGGGPAGMEAARVMALRGHRVALYEKKPRLGGQVNLAMIPPCKEELRNILEYFIPQMERLKVQVILQREVTRETIEKENPEVVILAAGASPLLPEIPGLARQMVFTPEEALGASRWMGEKILVAGDHILNDITPNIQLWSDERNPLEEYFASLDKVSELDIELVLPGHRSIFRNCRERIQELKQHHQKRLDEIISILEKEISMLFR
jgi:2,4-dienoyl-CoA reductase (NADPH2)